MHTAAKSLLLLLLLAGSACAGAGGSQTGPTGRRNPNLLTSADLARSTSQTVHDAVRQLRPTWLRIRGQASFSAPQEIAVYMDGVRMGGPEVLQVLAVEVVESLEFVDALTATQRFGTDHTNGAILVKTR